MSFESRLKARLESDALVVSPDVTGALDSVRRRHVVRRRTRIAAYSAAVAMIAVGAWVVAPRVLDAIGDARSAPAAPNHEPSRGDGYSRISGVYTTRIEDRPGLIRNYDLSGRWTLRLSGSGLVSIDAPAGFERALGPPTETDFTLAGGRLTTNVLYHDGLGCTGDAIYAWALNGPALRLTEVNDDCPFRPSVMTSVWMRR